MVTSLHRRIIEVTGGALSYAVADAARERVLAVVGRTSVVAIHERGLECVDLARVGSEIITCSTFVDAGDDVPARLWLATVAGRVMVVESGRRLTPARKS
jgi:hypothetical protein